MLTSVLIACIVGVAVVLLTNLHLHFFVKPKALPQPRLSSLPLSR